MDIRYPFANDVSFGKQDKTQPELGSLLYLPQLLLWLFVDICLVMIVESTFPIVCLILTKAVY